MKKALRTIPLLAVLHVLIGCGGPRPDVDASGRADGGRGSGAVCVDGDGLTYESFAQPFFETYCTRCHASDLVGAARMGAPLDHDFDTLDGIRDEALHIDQQAAIGENRENRFMPPSGMPLPSDDERRRLGVWLACGAP